MRTTLTLDDDVLAAARQLAHESGQSLGSVVSDLARRTITATEPVHVRNGIRLLPPSASGSVVTMEDVNQLRDETP